MEQKKIESRIYHNSCSICTHIQRINIESEKYQKGRTLDQIVRSVNSSLPPASNMRVSKSALSRHFAHADSLVVAESEKLIEGVIRDVADAKQKTLELALGVYHEIKAATPNNPVDVRFYAAWHQLIKLAMIDLNDDPSAAGSADLVKLWEQQRQLIEQKKSTPTLFTLGGGVTTHERNRHFRSHHRENGTCEVDIEVST